MSPSPGCCVPGCLEEDVEALLVILLSSEHGEPDALSDVGDDEGVDDPEDAVTRVGGLRIDVGGAGFRDFSGGEEVWGEGHELVDLGEGVLLLFCVC